MPVLTRTYNPYMLTITDVLIPYQLIPSFLRSRIRLPVCELTIDELVAKVFDSGKFSLDIEDAMTYARLVRNRHPLKFHGGKSELTVSLKAGVDIAQHTADSIFRFYFPDKKLISRAVADYLLYYRRLRALGYPTFSNDTCWHYAYMRIINRCDIMWYDNVEDAMSDNTQDVDVIVNALDSIRRWYSDSFK